MIKGILLLLWSTYCVLILRGHFDYDKEKIKKYKWFWIISIIVLYFGGTAMLLNSIIKISGIKL